MFNRDQEATRKGGETIIAQGVKVDGDFVSDGPVVIDGEVNGSVKTLGHLEVGSTAKIEASVSAGEAVIAGKVSGNLTVTGKLDLLESSVVDGDIEAEVLSVAPGAKLNGRVSMTGSRSNKGLEV
ncbi:MAG: polymer-forming cytoskeletal protein [Candidatus Uhrbacteria bacterium]